jgi:cytosine/adenosine deaminase-related metal-dependent hydrolase
MKCFTAQYVITGTGRRLKRAVITTEDDGTIINIEDTTGILKEKHSTEFYNGIIVPGFINAHCHLELSHLKSQTKKKEGLGGFIEQIRNNRNSPKETIISAVSSADNLMYSEGIVLCADICNTPDSFDIKKESRIRYINLLEVFGLDPEKAPSRMADIIRLAEKAREMDLPYYLIPHSPYSISMALFRILRNETQNNKVTSIHFMETPGEETFLKHHTGPLMLSYERSGLIPPIFEIPENHAEVILNEITKSGNLILVHCTFADRDIIRLIKKRKNLYWCLCPNSNIYIENTLPPVKLLIEEGCEIIIGTDSMASNDNLSILEELKTIQLNFPDIPIEDLVSWATINGAKALGEQEQFGSIEPGKKPGLLLIENADLLNMKFLPESTVRRLI